MGRGAGHPRRGQGSERRASSHLSAALPETTATSPPPPQRFDNLPAQATRLIGRQEQLVAARDLLRSEGTRLLTLTGPPGIGKTRMALSTARETANAFTHGVCFVDLSAIRDEALVVYAIARSLGIRELAGRSPLEQVRHGLQRSQMLLVLDNFEQVVAAGPQIASLLSASPALKILVTSREPLHLAWEQEFPVPPLHLPDLTALPSVEVLANFPAIVLFVERARAVDPKFALTAQNGGAVAELCVRLDGVPLAIELAAARVKLLPPDAMLDRLRDRFVLLKSAARDLPERHRTLYAATEWSYQLLTTDEQALFRRLAVFVGGFTLPGAEAVCAGPDLRREVLDLLASLIDKSLLRREDQENGGVRFRFLETIREYAYLQLERSDDVDRLRSRHASFFLGLSESAEPELQGPAQAVWLERLERDHGNLRAALEWALGGADLEAGVRLAMALGWFWYVRGHLGEGRMWLERALSVRGGISTSSRARTLYKAGMLARRQGDYARAAGLGTESRALYEELGDKRGAASTIDMLVNIAWSQGQYEEAAALAEESLRMSRELGDRSSIAASLNSVGLVARRRGEFGRAEACFQESLALYRNLGDKRSIAFMLNNLALLARYQGDVARAAAMHEEGLALFRSLGDRDGTALLLNNLGLVARLQGDLARATALCEESLGLFRQLADKAGIAYALHSLALLAHPRGDHDRAAALLTESLTLRRHLGDRRGIAECFEGLAAVAHGRRQVDRAVRLLAASARLRETIGAPLTPVDRTEVTHRLAALRTAMKTPAFEARWTAGQAMSLDESIQYAEETAAAARKEAGTTREPTEQAGGMLTHREREVAALIAHGLSNREIATRLVITEKTAATHVQNILNKLGFNSRAQIAAWSAAGRLHGR